MKQFFTIFLALCTVCVFATETTVWTGNEPISWNTEVYQGTQFETPEGIFTGLKTDDTIRVTVTAGIDEPQYVMTFKAGPSWEWTDLVVNVVDTTMSYVVAADSIATQIADRGLIFRGQGYNITRIAIATQAADTSTTPTDTITPLQPGEVRVLWEGNETLAWNEVAEQSAEVGALLGENDQILVTVSAKGTAEWPKVLLRDVNSNSVGDDILLNDVTVFPYVATFTLTSVDAAAMQGGFKLCGDGVTVTKMELKKYDPNAGPGPGPDTTAIDFSVLYEKVLWTGSRQISWNSEEYAGDKFDTYVERQDLFAGLQVGHVIAVAVETDGEAQYALKYKAGDDWTWTELSLNTKTEGILAYKVQEEEIAELVADRGLVMDGIRYKVTKISLYAETEWQSALHVLDEQFDGQRYNILGQPVSESYRGIVIVNGKKILVW